MKTMPLKCITTRFECSCLTQIFLLPSSYIISSIHFIFIEALSIIELRVDLKHTSDQPIEEEKQRGTRETEPFQQVELINSLSAHTLVCINNHGKKE